MGIGLKKTTGFYIYHVRRKIMNEAHAKKLAERQAKRREKHDEEVRVKYEEEATKFLNNACLNKYGISLETIAYMFDGKASVPADWDWDKYYEWQGYVNSEFAAKNRIGE